MLRYVRLYRLIRITIGIVSILPRYVWLNAREQFRPAGPAAWNRVHLAAARQIERLALDLGGAMTKAAQIGGARADILPDPFIDILSQFHDAVPVRPLASLRPVVEADLGCRLEEAFASVDEVALAAASLAQVHRAKLHDGSDVVLKIQYPEVKRIIPLDLSMLRTVVGMVRIIQRRIDLRSVIHEVTRFIELEVDFRREVDATERLDAVLSDHTEVVVPQVHRELCGDMLIVLEYLDGIQVTRTGQLVAAGHALPEVARSIGDLYGAMIFEYGFFHGDPHPGNLLVLHDGRIGLLDYGLCKELPAGFARSVAEMMISAMIGDSVAAAAAAEEIGIDTSEIRPEYLRSLMLMMVGDSDGDEGFFDIMSETRIRRIPEHFALVIRTLILLNGLSERLTPNRRLMQGQLIQHLAIGARESLGVSEPARCAG
jgi:predicted unusual protein kinase regulating ubiquinone biosynthesis (AarF/ABC1/UbiB family)